MFASVRQFSAVRRHGDRFLHEFEHAATLEDGRGSPPARAEPAHARLNRALQFLQDVKPAMGGTAERRRGTAVAVEGLRLVLDTQTNAERDRLGNMLAWLATIGAVSPLLACSAPSSASSTPSSARA